MSNNNNLSKAKLEIILNNVLGQGFSLIWESDDEDFTFGQLADLLLKNSMVGKPYPNPKLGFNVENQKLEFGQKLSDLMESGYSVVSDDGHVKKLKVTLEGQVQILDEREKISFKELVAPLKVEPSDRQIKIVDNYGNSFMLKFDMDDINCSFREIIKSLLDKNIIDKPRWGCSVFFDLVPGNKSLSWNQKLINIINLMQSKNRAKLDKKQTESICLSTGDVAICNDLKEISLKDLVVQSDKEAETNSQNLQNLQEDGKNELADNNQIIGNEQNIKNKNESESTDKISLKNQNVCLIFIVNHKFETGGFCVTCASGIALGFFVSWFLAPVVLGIFLVVVFCYRKLAPSDPDPDDLKTAPTFKSDKNVGSNVVSKTISPEQERNVNQQNQDHNVF